MNLSRRFADLRIRYKLLISYSAVFVLSLSIGSGVIYSSVKEVIETNIESELTNTTQTILNMVRTSAGVSIKNHLRAVAEKNREIAQHFYGQALAGTIRMEEAKSRTREVMLSQTIGKTGYIYCIGSQGAILIHPEDALVNVDLSDHPEVAECAVLGVEDKLKGQSPIGFLVLNAGVDRDHADIQKEVVQMVRDRIGPVEAFKTATVVNRLPKTRSGKILRGTIQKIADNKEYNVPATIDDPTILGEVEEALKGIGYASSRKA